MEDYTVKLHEILCAQYNMRTLQLDTLRAARKCEEIGLTSLGTIMLVATYLEARGLPDAMFDPDWISDFDTVDGILLVLRIIDQKAAK